MSAPCSPSAPCYGGGHDVPWDRVAAQRWFRAAAERGHPYAQMMLGRYLARKLAGEQNIEEARRWTERAVAQGMQEAKADLAALPPAPEPDESSLYENALGAPPASDDVMPCAAAGLRRG